MYLVSRSLYRASFLVAFAAAALSFGCGKKTVAPPPPPADFLKSNPNFKVTIEGHCDERGSTEYNLGLGDRRASAVKQYLVSLGVPADRLSTVSFGKEKPFCMESTEACWQQNRRGHFVRAN